MKNFKSVKPTKELIFTVAYLAASFGGLIGLMGSASAIASPFQQMFVRLDNINPTTATGGRVCFKPSVTNGTGGGTVQTVAQVVVRFPTASSGTDWIVNGTAANWTVTTTGLDTGQTALPTVATATSATAATKTVIFPLGTPQSLASTTLYCFNFSGTTTLTTSSASAPQNTGSSTIAQVTTQTAGAATIDQTNYDLQIIANDQIVLQNATVPPSFAFTLSGNTDSFSSNLTPGSVVTTAGKTVTIVTNAASGWIVWAQDLAANASGGKGSLASTTANYKITGIPALGGASATLSAEGYGMGVTVTTNGSGSAAANAAYDGASSKFGTLDPGAYYPIASANNPTNTDVIQMTEGARASATTPAANDYSDTITLVGAGKF